MTDAERKLWRHLRLKQVHGLTFYRQKVIGSYIVDFYCHKAGLVIEVDGGQHFTEQGREADEGRDAYLFSLGLSVLRFSNHDVLQNIGAVLDRIDSMVRRRARHLSGR